MLDDGADSVVSDGRSTYPDSIEQSCELSGRVPRIVSHAMRGATLLGLRGCESIRGADQFRDDVAVARSVAGSARRKATPARDYPASERRCKGKVVSRLGFEPRTRGLKVSVEAVHGATRGAFTSIPRVELIHRLHHVGPSTTAVAGSVAGKGLGRASPRAARTAVGDGRGRRSPGSTTSARWWGTREAHSSAARRAHVSKSRSAASWARKHVPRLGTFRAGLSTACHRPCSGRYRKRDGEPQHRAADAVAHGPIKPVPRAAIGHSFSTTENSSRATIRARLSATSSTSRRCPRRWRPACAWRPRPEPVRGAAG